VCPNPRHGLELAQERGEGGLHSETNADMPEVEPLGGLPGKWGASRRRARLEISIRVGCAIATSGRDADILSKLSRVERRRREAGKGFEKLKLQKPRTLFLLP